MPLSSAHSFSVITPCESVLVSKAQYVLCTFFDVLGCSLRQVESAQAAEGMLIGYGHLNESLRQQFLTNGGLFFHAASGAASFFSQRTALSKSDAATLTWRGQHVPFFFDPTLAGRSLDFSDLAQEASRGFWEISGDIIAAAFFFLSRWEEPVCGERDRHGRFPYACSLSAQLGCSSNVVDTYFDILLELLNRARRAKGLHELEIPLWPAGKTFAACLSHDVDRVHWRWPSRLKFTWDHLRNPVGRFRAEPAMARIGYATRWLVSSRDPYWTFPTLLDWERSFDFSSTVLFQAIKRHTYSCDYLLSELRILRLMDQLQTEGLEIGLHGTYAAATAPELFLAEKSSLESISGRPVVTNRQHFLHLDYEVTMSIYEMASLECDMSLGYAEHPGYRNSFSYPYHPYNIQEDRPYTYVELPTVIMDSTLHGPNYLNFEAEAAWNVVRSLLAQARDRHACIGIMWHNDTLFEGLYPGYGDLYLRILTWIEENNGAGLSGQEVVRQWKDGRDACRKIQ